MSFSDFGEPFGRAPPRPTPPPVEEARIESVQVDDLLVLPGRLARPDHIVVVIRGPPGAGKTYLSKLIKVNTVFYIFFKMFVI